MRREVVVVIGPGQIGQAIARRVGVGKHVLLADKQEDNAKAAAETLGNAGYGGFFNGIDPKATIAGVSSLQSAELLLVTLVSARVA